MPEARCTAVYGGKKIELGPGTTLRVVRWNHRGDSIQNAEQHNPVELSSGPRIDAISGGLRLGVAEAFPNGGGNRAYLSTVDRPRGRFSWFVQDSVSPVDLPVAIILDGKDYGAPLENLKAAMRDAGIDRIDLWIGTGGTAVARPLVRALRPKASMPAHRDDFFAPFERSVTTPYSSPELGAFLAAARVKLITPQQLMDKWGLEADGIAREPDDAVQDTLGFAGPAREAR